MNRAVRDTLVAVASAVTAVTATYFAAVRPWVYRWGATDEEIERELPGDELLNDPALETTRAVTINATPAEIWPWLVQIGQDRGGFYSYEWLENLFKLDIHNADDIEPEFQDLEVDDFIALAPQDAVGMMVARIDPERALVLLAPERDFAEPIHSPIDEDELELETSWAFVLDPVSEDKTRLLVRFRLRHEPSLATSFLREAILGPVHFLMERKMLLGIKERVEANRVENDLAVYRLAHVA